MKKNNCPLSGNETEQAQEQPAIAALKAEVQALRREVRAIAGAVADLPETLRRQMNPGDFRTVGSIVTYGHYWKGSDGLMQPIEWIVMDYDPEKDQAKLLSRYGLDSKVYHKGKAYPTWEKSSIRKWLNGKFLNTAFSAEERKRIAQTLIHTEDNREWKAFQGVWPYRDYSHEEVSGGNDCTDRIFLLSLEEAMAYAGFATLTDLQNNDCPKLMTTATAYAQAQGAEPDEDNGCCWWWLRSPGYDHYEAARIDCSGSLAECDNVDYADNAVRPAMILDLGAV